MSARRGTGDFYEDAYPDGAGMMAALVFYVRFPAVHPGAETRHLSRIDYPDGSDGAVACDATLDSDPPHTCFICTRDAGHPGLHAAYGFLPDPLAVWGVPESAR